MGQSMQRSNREAEEGREGQGREGQADETVCASDTADVHIYA
jgi:hypothetical protein